MFFLKLNYEHTSLLEFVDGSLLAIRYSTNRFLSLAYKAWHSKLQPSHFPSLRPPPTPTLHWPSGKNLFSLMHFAVSHLSLLMTFYKIGHQVLMIAEPFRGTKLPKVIEHSSLIRYTCDDDY